ncbi:MAG: hypothetical protein C0525_12450 [Flavobacterium sp.]|nr:hypothetical protein [Flavobacterium sp.]
MPYSNHNRISTIILFSALIKHNFNSCHNIGIKAVEWLEFVHTICTLFVFYSTFGDNLKDLKKDIL